MNAVMMLLRWWMASLKHPATYIFWVLLILYHADGRGHGEIDCVAAPYAAWAFVRTGSFDVQHYEALKPYFHTSALRQSIDGRMVPVRSPGSTLAVVPFVAPFALIHERPLSSPSMHAIGRLAGATYVALLGAVFFIMCRRFAPSSAWPALILVTLGSCLYSVAAQAIWVHGPATFWLMISLELQTRKEFRRWLPFLAGLALGLAVLCRPTTAVFGVASGVAWLLMWDRRLLALIGGGLIPVGYLCWVNWCHYGSPLLGGYSAEATLEAPPFDVAFAGLLVAPSRGLFVYSPACLLLPLGFAALVRRNDLPQVLLWCWSAAALGTIILFARWHDWRGGWCYGPRFLCECWPIIGLLFAIGVDHMTRNRRWIAWLLVAVSVVIHALGVYGASEYEAWQMRHDPHVHPEDPYGRSLFEWHDTQIEAHARGLWRKITR